MLYSIKFMRLGLQGIMYSMVLANGLTTIITLAYSFNKAGFAFEYEKLIKIVRFGLPLIPAGILIFLLYSGDRFILNRLTDLGEVGIYALGYKFGMLVGDICWQSLSSSMGTEEDEYLQAAGQL